MKRIEQRQALNVVALVAAAATGCVVLAGCATPTPPAGTHVTAPPTQKSAAVPAAPPGTVTPSATVRPPATVTPPATVKAPATAAPVTSAPVTTAGPVVTAPAPATAPVTAAAGAQPVGAVTVPHFASPDDAMRYLVAAYNAHDIAAERHVTTPDSRDSLEGERQWVNTFSFNHCDSTGDGDYQCQFDMVSKVATNATGTDAFGNDLQSMGEITVTVAPADRPGWYMAANLGCGDAMIGPPAS